MNPYQEWLGWSGATEPNYYDLLQLQQGESDAEKIAAAADRSIARVRSFRPGEQAQQWAQLLDELNEIKKVLLDTQAKARYDEQLQQPHPAAPAESTATVEHDDDGPTMSFKEVGQSVGEAWLPPSADAPATAPPAVEDPSVTPPDPAAETTPLAEVVPVADEVPPADAGTGQPPPPPTAPLANSAEPVPEPDTMFEEILEEVIPVDEPPPGADLPPAATAQSDVSPEADLPPAAEQLPPTTDDLPPAADVPPPAASEVTADATPPVAKAILAKASAIDPMTPVPIAKPVAKKEVSAEPLTVDAVAPKSKVNWIVLAVGILIGVGGVSVAGFFLLKGNSAAQDKEVAKGEPQTPDKKEQKKEKQEKQPSGKETTTKSGIKQGNGDKQKKQQGASDKKLKGSPDSKGKKDSPPATKKKAEKKGTTKKVDPSKKGTKKKAADTTKKKAGKKKADPGDEPTSREVTALSKAMIAAKEALGTRDWEKADKNFARADKLPKLKKHAAMLARLKLVSKHVRDFWGGVKKTIDKFEGAEEIKVGSTMMIVVDADDKELTVKFLGKTRVFKRNKLPNGVAMALSDMAQGDSPQAPVLRGAFLFVQEDLDDDDLKDIRGLWEGAELNGVTIGELMNVLKDKYDEMSAD